MDIRHQVGVLINAKILNLVAGSGGSVVRDEAVVVFGGLCLMADLVPVKDIEFLLVFSNKPFLLKYSVAGAKVTCAAVTRPGTWTLELRK